MLDAAYAEYVTRNDYAAGIELVATCDNVVMTRTFSKIHGLANLAPRLGLWARACDRRAEPHARTVQRQRRGAGSWRRGLGDAAHIEDAVAHNERWLPWLAEADRQGFGIEVTPSVGNFLLLPFPRQPGATRSGADAFLTARGFILRAVAAYGLPDCLRMTVGGEEANEGRGRGAGRVHAGRTRG